MKKITCLLFGFLFALLTMSKGVFASTVVATNPQDPYENYNRHVFRMNDTLDRNFLKPVARAFNALPYPFPQGVRHFFDNLAEIPTVIDDLLQGQFYHATADTWRLGINSTLGIGGFFDVASKMSLKPHTNDFGLTLARWGYKSSAYFVIPILGPSTIRDAVGILPDYYAFSVYPHIYPWTLRYSLLGLNGLSMRADLLNYEGVLEEVSIDPYVFQRDAYLQHRNAIINQTN